jgi:hypothetical protein
MSEASATASGQVLDEARPPMHELVERARGWACRACAEGWLSPAEAAALEGLDPAAPADLFVDPESRPLVVAFFGGTGVGKSSLLNRLAGAAVARVGVRRPTSREVTLYVHESVGLARLRAGSGLSSESSGAAGPSPSGSQPAQPAGDPALRGIVVHGHSNPAQRDVVWVDMPDIDSTHEANRHLALSWLPHIDLLVYVVSPERYRDDAGWRLLVEQGGRHGWMFVFNRWDEGDPAQREDFIGMLRTAGFPHPLVFCTCCLPAPPRLPSPDEFDRLHSLIHDMIREHGVRELERLGLAGRLRELREALLAAVRRLGRSQDWNALREQWRQRWTSARGTILEGAEWPIQMVSARLALRERHFLGELRRRLMRRPEGAAAEPGKLPFETAAPLSIGRSPVGEQSDEVSPPDLVALVGSLWDDWAQSRTESAVDALEVDARRAGLPESPIRAALGGVAGQAAASVTRALEQSLRAALARPGSPLRRAARRVTGFLMALLPAVALAWIASVVVWRFYAASRGQGVFLGLDFVVNAALLVLVSWAVPAALDRLLRPALERVLVSALRKGLAEALDGLEGQAASALEQTARRAHLLREEGLALATQISGLIHVPGPQPDELLRRFVPVQRSSGHATTDADGCAVSRGSGG